MPRLRFDYSTVLIAGGGTLPYAGTIDSGTLPTGLTLDELTRNGAAGKGIHLLWTGSVGGAMIDMEVWTDFNCKASGSTVPPMLGLES